MSTKTPEQKASEQVRLSASRLGIKLMRNNNGAFINDAGALVRFGLGNEKPEKQSLMKSSDYIGAFELTITPEMVGKKVAVLTTIEVKPEGTLGTVINKAMKYPKSREGKQLAFIEWIRSMGGLAWFASSESDVNAIFELFMKDLKNGRK